MSAMVVYVHGLWFNGWESAWLRRSLSRELGCETCSFPYSSMSADMAENASALARFLATTQADTLHLVGHSLGGLVILEFFASSLSAQGLPDNGRSLPPGRVVLLGSPVRGSITAQRLGKLPFGKAILGSAAAGVLLTSRERSWNGARDLGTIAGDVPLGLGRLLGSIDAPNDGTVLVEETCIEGAKERLRLPVTHSGMVFSALVARQTAAFLRDGRFSR
jgi:pimeloyl-ACP methyl ester carboxylesterase